MNARAAVIRQLREKIERLKGEPRSLLFSLQLGIPELDTLGFFRMGTGVALAGDAVASGRTSLALSVVAAACRERRLAAWIDGPKELYPPTAQARGVQLSQLLIVRPREPRQLVWTAVQLLRSGSFACVVLDIIHTGLQLTSIEVYKLLDAARTGGGLLLVLTAGPGSVRGLPRITVAKPRPRGRHGARGPEELELLSPHGQRHTIRWALAQDFQKPGAIAPTPSVPTVFPTRSFHRPPSNFDRDGFSVVYGRPGREGPIDLPGRSWR